MTEEELAKLSINLLNCQLEVSGRSQVTCTDDMSLKECTSPMDDETWNAYHTINNRARAVCYATRQQQFRMLSEMTVNKLMSSALKQVTSMESLKELQKELNLLTSETMSSLTEGQKGLANQNSGMQLAQRKIMDDISRTIRQLTKEKTLIQNTQSQLDSLSRKLSYQFDEAESRLGTQSELHQETHKQILSHLEDITQKADILWKLLEHKSEKVIKQQDEIQKRMQEALDSLIQINCSVNYLKGLVDQVKADVDSKILWATTAIGMSVIPEPPGTQRKQSVQPELQGVGPQCENGSCRAGGDKTTLVLVLQHCLLLVAGVLVSLFLQLSIACRLSLLIAVLFNIALVYYRQPLTLLSLSGTIVGYNKSAVNSF
ncbi:hypothetical protein J6590_012114 [Homalodisca vitripennis]|nr:hypothetical protein J6590_012114 [Homalodisca vitripennis]